MNTSSIPSVVPPIHSFCCYKILLAIGIACVSILLAGCTNSNETTEGELVTKPVTENEAITTQASDALAFADENTDYPYTDITDDILVFIDEANKMLYGVSTSELDDESIERLAQNFYDKMPDVNVEKTEFSYFKDAKLSNDYNGLINVPMREFYELPQGITIPAQDAVNQAAAVIKGAFAPNCTIENAYIYYSDSLIDDLEDQRSWVVLLSTTLNDGTSGEFTVRIDAVTGVLQQANYMGAFHCDNALVTDKTYSPITKDNYETYAAETLTYLLAAGVPVDENVTPIVTKYMTISYYAIVYTTTSGDHYQAFLYTDGSCAVIKRCDNWALQSKQTGTVEEMQNYTIDF